MTPDQRAAALRLARYAEVGGVQAPTGAEIAALLRELATVSNMETAEPQRQPLTEAQINDLPEARGWWPCSLNDRIFRLIRAIERAQGVTGEKT